MPIHQSLSYDVIIAGAGPVGLFLACELRLAGASVLVLERAADQYSELKQMPFGMRGLSAPTLEALHRRGLLDAVQSAQRAGQSMSAAAGSHWMQQAKRPAGHFAGLQFFHEDVDQTRLPNRLPSPAGVNLAVDMQSLEAVFTERALALGVLIRRGFGVETFDVTEDGVTVYDQDKRIEARWLVGCDGGRSAVRKAGGFSFAGTDPEFTGYSVEAELTDPDRLVVGRTYTATGMYTYARPGVVAMVDFDGGAAHRREPLTLEHVQAVLRRISGVDVTLKSLKLAATWTDRAMQVTEYRRQSVLLAGDAAHIHSPLGGQGLNLGLGDAMNLGWKLGAVIRGEQPAGFLDSYEGERHPEGARILDWSRAQVALMQPNPGARALANVMRDLIGTRDGATYFAEKLWNVALHYDLGGAHALVGRSVPEFIFRNGMRTGELLRSGRALLLDFVPGALPRNIIEPFQDRLTYVASAAEDRLNLCALLVRPDGVVAWASEAAGDVAGLQEAVSRWVAQPAGL